MFGDLIYTTSASPNFTLVKVAINGFQHFPVLTILGASHRTIYQFFFCQENAFYLFSNDLALLDPLLWNRVIKSDCIALYELGDDCLKLNPATLKLLRAGSTRYMFSEKYWLAHFVTIGLQVLSPSLLPNTGTFT